MPSADCQMKNTLDNTISNPVSHSAPGTRHSAFGRALFPALVLFLACPGRAEPPAAAAPDAALTLENSIRLALANNQSIKVDSYSRSIARANLLAAYGSFDPSLNFSRSYSESYSPTLATTDTGFLPPATLIQTDNYGLFLSGIMPWGLQYSIGGSANNQRGTFNSFANNFQTFGGIQVTQPLLRGFGFAGSAANLAVRVAKAERGISDWQFRQSVIATITNVVAAYTNLSFAHAYLDAVRRYHDSANQLYRENQKRYKVGAVSSNDVTSAEARAAAREHYVVEAEQSVRDADNQLRLLLGEQAFANEGPLLTVEPLTEPDYPIHPAADLKRAYELRPDYQQARLALQERRYNQAYARNQVLPHVNFVGSYGYAGLGSSLADSRRMVENRDNRYYSAGVEISVPITFAQSRGRARAARLQREQAEAQLQLLAENIALDVAKAAGQIETARKSVAANASAKKLNDELLAAELKRLRAGTGSTFSVLYQQDNVFPADLQYLSSIAALQRDIAAYQQEIGTTLEDYHVTLDKQHPVPATNP